MKQTTPHRLLQDRLSGYPTPLSTEKHVWPLYLGRGCFLGNSFLKNESGSYLGITLYLGT